jgi:deoxyribose-phosphate aldolase
VPVNRAQLAKMIDYAILKADTTEKEIQKMCAEAVKYHVASVCVNPAYVGLAANILKGTDVKIGSVVDFPLGQSTVKSKSFEALDCITRGAQEIDMVMNVGALKSGHPELVKRGIEAVVKLARAKEPEIGQTITIKVIIEACYLTDQEKRTASELVQKAGADFVKTSTGFGTGGATADDVKLIRQTVGFELGVKASGGIKNCEQALRFVEAGATRIGTSHAVAILEECAE